MPPAIDRQRVSRKLLQLLAGDGAVGAQQVEAEFGDGLPVPHPDQLAHAGLRSAVLAVESGAASSADPSTEPATPSPTSAAELLEDAAVVARPAVGGQREQRLDLLADARPAADRDPLVDQRRAGELPAVVDLPDEHVVRDEHVVEEDLVEHAPRR